MLPSPSAVMWRRKCALRDWRPVSVAQLSSDAVPLPSVRRQIYWNYADRLQQTGVYLSILDIILFARHMNKAGTLLASMFGVGVTVGSHPRAGDLRHPRWHSARKPGGITW